ncbi:MAG: hypothetical protein JWM64_1122 [Frankiales bacterium]|nr:hypothetical protein [Frankiales bacterium]
MTARSAVTSTAAHARSTTRAAADFVRGRSTVEGAVVLAYHDVVADDVVPGDYGVTRGRFRTHLRVLERLGLEVVPLQVLAERVRAGTPLRGLATVAFDDALVGVHRHALPELAGRGWPSTLHPVVGALGVDPPWWPGSQRTMTLRELQEAVREGVEVGAHGTTHACLPCLADAPLREELHVGRQSLQELTGRPVTELAYPYGHHDARVRDAAHEAGYRTGWSFSNGRVLSADDPWALRRLTMHQGVSGPRLAEQLARTAAAWGRAAAQQHPHVTIPTQDRTSRAADRSRP